MRTGKLVSEWTDTSLSSGSEQIICVLACARIGVVSKETLRLATLRRGGTMVGTDRHGDYVASMFAAVNIEKLGFVKN